MKIAITEILIDTRRREEMGDLAGLAKSIEQYGLLHPVVLDDNRHLIAGMRRIEACKRLGWTEIEARFHGELTTEQRDRLELEENIKRKDLTIAEQSKNMKALAKQIETELKAREEEQKASDDNTEFLSVTDKNSSPQKRPEGRPPKADAQNKVADAMGVAPTTLKTNLAYADAVEKYPDLATTPGVPMQDAIIMAKALDNLPEDARAQKVQALHEGQPGILADVRGLPPMPPPEPKPPDYQKAWSAGIKHMKQGLEKLSDDETLQGMKQKWKPEVAKTQHGLLMTFADRLHIVGQDILDHEMRDADEC